GARVGFAARGDERGRFGEAAVEHARCVGVGRRRIGKRGGGGEIECRKHGGSSRQAGSNTKFGLDPRAAPPLVAGRSAWMRAAILCCAPAPRSILGRSFTLGPPIARAAVGPRYTRSQKYSPDAIPLNISSPDSMMFCRQ